MDISEIHKPIIEKYLKDRNFPSQSFEFLCPECGNLEPIPSYNPAQKPKRLKCSMCTKIICIRHNMNIYSCFCFCPSCKKQTISIANLNLSFCQLCQQRHCFTCKKTINGFCKCICQVCKGLDTKDHECEASCHHCNSRVGKLKVCPCGLSTCYSCFYSLLEGCKNPREFPCCRTWSFF